MSKKKKKQPEYGQYCFCYRCGKALCKATDLPHFDANYCSNCGNKLTDTKRDYCKNSTNVELSNNHHLTRDI